MSPRAEQAGPLSPEHAPATPLTSALVAPTRTRTLAFVESPVQLLNVLEWAHRTAGARGPADAGADGRAPDGGVPDGRARDGCAAGEVSAAPDFVPERRPGGLGGVPAPGGSPDAASAAWDRGSGTGPEQVPGTPAARSGPALRPVSSQALRAPEPGVFPQPSLGEHPAELSGTGGERLGATEPWRDGPRQTAAESGAPGRVPSARAADARDGRSAAAGQRETVAAARAAAPRPASTAVTIVVLSPTDPMTRGQLRRMAELAREEGHQVRWEEARGASTAPLGTIRGLAPLLRAARRIVIGDPFSRYVQLLLTITRARDLVVVDDGTATMEFIAQLARGERLVRWHRRGGRPGARELVFAPVSAAARRRLTPGRRRTVEVFSSMPIVDAPDGVRVTANDFGWTRARFGPPRVLSGADLVGTSLVETGVVDRERYLAAVSALARTHGATRYFAHRREDTGKLHRLAVETGLEIVRPDLPLELIARRGPVGRTILSFPSTVVHTLPLALTGTGVRVAVCDIDPAWLTAHASPRAEGFLAGVTDTARDVQRLDPAPEAGTS